MLLLTEHSDQVELLVENTDEGKTVYLEGIFSSADKPNRNGRMYPRPVLERALDSFVKNSVNENKAIGSINHPTNPIPDPREAAIMVESLSWKGSDIVGKAKVLSTPEGNILKGLLESGYKTGISSRGIGSVKEMKSGINEVQDNFKLFAYDAVHNPSNYGSEMNTMMESVEWIFENGVYIQKQSIDEDLLLELLEKHIRKA